MSKQTHAFTCRGTDQQMKELDSLMAVTRTRTLSLIHI